MKPRARTARRLATSPFAAGPAAPEKTFAVQDRVTHDRYGLGRVVSVEPDVAVIVEFGSQRRRVVAPYAKLDVL